MSSPFHHQVDQLMAEFAQQQSRLLSVRQELEKASVSATSKDHLVTVTVGVSGEIRRITFHGTEYAAMAPAELGSALVAVLNQAREAATRQAEEAFRPLSTFGSELRDSLAGGTGLTELFGPLSDALRPRRQPPAGEEDVDG